MIVAIDGPAGAGKSTLARLLAQALNLQLIETGALYRAVGLLALERGVELTDTAQLKSIAASLDISFRFEGGTNRVMVHSIDRTAELRAEAVSSAASRVSSIPEVRAALLELQRSLGGRSDSVLEGRDIGTVVFPNADAKFFVTAAAEERARRRVAQLESEGAEVVPDYRAVLVDIEERDRRDRERETAPLRQAADAVLIDTTSISTDTALDRIRAVIESR